MKKLKQKPKSKEVIRGAQNTVGFIVSEKIDFWMTGGISIIVMLILLLYSAITVQSHQNVTAAIGGMIILQALINWPHFMGSYSLLYSSKSQIKKYQSATIWAPIFLFLILVGATSLGRFNGDTVFVVNSDAAYVIWIIAAFYLAWHYAGQAWGLISSFSFLSGTEYRDHERDFIKWGVKTLIVWHVVWGAADLPEKWFMGFYDVLPIAQNIINLISAINFIVGIFIWFNIYKRQGWIDRRILAVWLSIYLWYLVLYFSPDAYPFVQLSHAMQYLIFPLRVEMNKRATQAKMGGRINQSEWVAVYSILLIASGIFVFWVPNYFSDPTQTYTFSAFIASLVAIHHYFVDGCIWKISNPEVKKSLFLHLSIKA